MKEKQTVFHFLDDDDDDDGDVDDADKVINVDKEEEKRSDTSAVGN